MANRPIIQIQVDDSQFKKFLETYKEYQKSIDDMPGTWTKVGEAADKTNQHLKTMMGNVGGIAKGFTSIAASIAKIGLFGGAIAAGAVFGVDKLANGVAQNQRSARANGLTLGQQSAFRVNASRYIDPDSFLGAVASARQNPQQLASFASLGVNIGANESNYDLSKSVLLAIKDKYDETHNLGLMHALGASDFLSDQDIQTLGNTPNGEFNTALNTMDKDSKGLAIPDKTADQWALLSVQFARASAVINKAVVEGLAPLTPLFTALSSATAQAAANMTILAARTEAEVAAAGAGNGGPNVPGNTKPAIAPNPNDVTQNWPPALRNMLGMPPIKGDPRYNPAPGPLPAPKPMSQQELGSAAGAMNYFMKHGWDKKSAAGLASQFAFESDYDPNAVSFDPKTGLKHAGMLQWDATRRWAILQGTASKSHPGIDVWNDSNPQDQYAAAQWELTHTEKAAADSIRSAKTASQAGVIADNTYARSGDSWYKQASRGLTAGVLNNTVKIKIENPAGANVHHTVAAMLN